jgi:hypothetical protein
LVLENPRPLPEPMACRGALGLWTLPPDVAKRCGEALDINRHQKDGNRSWAS